MKLKYAIPAILIAFAAGFLFCRETTQKEKIVRHEKADKVTGKVGRDVLSAEVEFLTSVTLIPYPYWVQDTVKEIIRLVPDTAAIIDDYMTKRQYRFIVFDDLTGKLVAKPTVLHNRLLGFEYEFTPIQKHTTVVKEKQIRPFLSGSINTFQTLGLGGGVLFNSIGVEYNFLHNFQLNQSGHELGIKYLL